MTIYHFAAMVALVITALCFSLADRRAAERDRSDGRLAELGKKLSRVMHDTEEDREL